MLSDTDVDDHYNPTIRLLDIEKNDQTTNCGFHLTRSKWDPYPWVSSVDRNTAAYLAGMKPGDCLLEVNGEDIVGQRISDVADIVKSNTKQVSLLLWNAGVNTQCKPEVLYNKKNQTIIYKHIKINSLFTVERFYELIKSFKFYTNSIRIFFLFVCLLTLN